MTSVITLQKIRKSYGSAPVLEDFSADFLQGEFSMITGGSGKGKTTLLHLIGLLDRTFSGSYLLYGEDMHRAKASRVDLIRNRYMGFVFQQYHLLPGKNVLENILLPSLYSHDFRKHTAMQHRARELIHSFHLEALSGRDIRTMSGGEMQRIAIARALLLDPPILLADEPTGNLDPENTRLVLECFRQQSDAGKTVIMVTHDPSVFHYADRILRL